MRNSAKKKDPFAGENPLSAARTLNPIQSE